MYNYPITVNIVSTAVYVPVCFAYIIPASLCLNPSPITAEEQAIPKSVFAVMGALDCLSSVMLVLAVNYVPNASTLVLLQQAAIPISMVISALAFVGVRYDRFQILGAAVVLLGIGVVLSPQLGQTQIVKRLPERYCGPSSRWRPACPCASLQYIKRRRSGNKT